MKATKALAILALLTGYGGACRAISYGSVDIAGIFLLSTIIAFQVLIWLRLGERK